MKELKFYNQKCNYRKMSAAGYFFTYNLIKFETIWTASSEFGTYRLCEQRRFRRACASAQSRQNLRYSLIQAVNQEEPSDRKPDPWPLWMAGQAQLKFVMTECSKTQIRLTGLIYFAHVLGIRTALPEYMHHELKSKPKVNRVYKMFGCMWWGPSAWHCNQYIIE